MTENIPTAICSGELPIGDMIFPCSVLADGTRILTQNNFMESMGMYYSGWVAKNKPKGQPADTPHFLAFKSLTPFINKHLGDLQSITVKYITERGKVSNGIKADIIPKICEIWMDAEEEGKLGKRQLQIAQKAKILMRALAHVGIIALVDEVTGYQEIRTRNALQDILDKFISKELRPWTKTFPDEFYENLFRLRGWPYKPLNVKRPGVVGRDTEDIIYKRLAPAILEELKKTTPRNEQGKLKVHYHRRLTDDIGHPKLREHIASVIALMRASATWNGFKRLLERSLPKYGDTYTMQFDDEE